METDMTDFPNNVTRKSTEIILDVIYYASRAFNVLALTASALIVLACAVILALNFYHVEIAEFILNWGSHFKNQTVPNRWILDH
jgi:hypothetical protein